MSKQVSLPKLSSIRQKMKIGQNSIYALLHEGLQLQITDGLKKPGNLITEPYQLK